MRSPLLIINSILAGCLLVIIMFILLSLRKITGDVAVGRIQPTKVKVITKEERPGIKDLKLIEDNDLFGTYKIEIEKPEIIKVPSIPEPPSPKPIAESQEPQVQFLDPLPIKISGIISSPNENKSQITLVNTKTNESNSYKVGDKLLDAYILRILPRKVIVIRSNGQQDTIFMYQEDAEKEIQELKETSWKEVVQKLSDTEFIINKENFVEKVESIANFIDMLDVTTAFKKGISIGCQIGNLDEKSIGPSLGLMTGDIILNISDIAPTNTENRINIYNKISTIKSNQTIKLEILRENKKLNYNYHIKTNNKEIQEDQKENIMALNKEQDILNAVKSIKRERNLSLSSKKFKSKDRYAMSKYGGKNTMFKHVKSN